MSRDVLFVYGTLLPGAADAMGRAERARLARESTRLGTARACGVLYDLGAYPVLVAGAGPVGLVRGEAVRLLDPVSSLGWLDLYEGIGERPGEYRREQIDIVTGDGRSLRAWAYLSVSARPAGRVIASGSWLER